MAPKTFIISVSLAGSLAGLAGWMMAGSPDAPEISPRERAAKAQKARLGRPFPGKSSAVSRAVTAGDPAAAGPAVSGGTSEPAVSQSWSTAELIERAARVEQEANHDLKRLVGLLDLSDEQQDQVLSALVRQSPSWSPEMQPATPDGIAYATAGTRSAVAGGGWLTAPAVTSPLPESGNPAITPGPGDSSEVTAPADTAAASDPAMDEIMALLSPEQQDTLVQEELDRTAWWAEILEQITPADDIPAIDGTEAATPGTGGTQAYEGSDVLE